MAISRRPCRKCTSSSRPSKRWCRRWKTSSQILRVLARSATGQEMSVYTTFSTGPRRPGDVDGPEEYHVVILDNGRSAMLGSEFQDMLRCIRCGACMNHCPVYHASAATPMAGSIPARWAPVLTPSLIGVDQAGHLPNASTFCGRCESVCPMKIPLPKMMRHWREREFERHLTPPSCAMASVSGRFSRSARSSTRLSTRIAMRRWPSRALEGRFSSLLGAGWTKYRDFAAPEGETFQAKWKRAEGRKMSSARDDILATIRRSLGVTGEERAAHCIVEERLERAPKGLIPTRGQVDAPARLALLPRQAGGRAGHCRRWLASRRMCPPPSRTICATTTCRRACAGAMIRALQAMPWHETALEVAVGRSRWRRSLPSAMPSRDRRNRHAGADLRPGKPDDAEFPARQPHRRALGERSRRRSRSRCGRASARATARATCRAR